MGKRLLVQRRGRGGSVFRSPSWKRVGDVRYHPILEEELNSCVEFLVKDIVHDPGRSAPVAVVTNSKGLKTLMVAPEGLFVGQKVYFGAQASPNVGNVLPLKNIPEGTLVCNIEGLPGDGGRYVRSAGSYATVVSHSGDSVIVQFPSGMVKSFSGSCRATVGLVAAGGIVEKPLLKAGASYHKYRSKSVKYPRVRGKAMSPYAHPHGGGSHPKGGRPVSRTAPPGQKVGMIAPKRTGRKKK
ncbi:MAG: 50S ribosomal protein L2 [Candidatus Verstraetearchaeota archaeon]|jgi:large subunit ribosomal protein L2|uniref:Large ribosomal subunit protein uL2 n=1 Tax=Thermoproteota archaeon TaxID=2056631 RepID=A0A523BAE1_9CREN|nr:50S ribosomal protein L2 [Candidatus Verstraetearchaeota archaeon]TDA37916.1 MAG: 50S ribosomal protein L2 [Candidatus Verstraetearchaeota archaeon]